MKVVNEIRVKEPITTQYNYIHVESVFNQNKCVMITVGNQSAVVLAEDLQRAIENSLNTTK